MQALQFIVTQPSLCSFLSTFTIGINMLPKLVSKFVHVDQCSTLLKHWPGPWNSIAKCYIPAQILPGGLFTDPIILRTDGLYHLGYIGQTVRTDLCSVTCMKSSVLGFRNLQSSWHVPKILLQQPPCSSHRYKYLVSLAQSFWSLNYPCYVTCSRVPRESDQAKIGIVKAALLRAQRSQ